MSSIIAIPMQHTKGQSRAAANIIAELADDPDARVNLMPMDENHMRNSIHSTFSFADSGDLSRFNPYDISRYIDRVRLICCPSFDPGITPSVS